MEAKSQRDLQAGGLGHATVEYVLGHSDFEARLERLRRTYAHRAQALLDALAEHRDLFEVRPPQGGFSVWVRSAARGPELELLERALAAGVVFEPGSLFRARRSRGSVWMRLSYSAGPPSAFPEGIARLAKVVRGAR